MTMNDAQPPKKSYYELHLPLAGFDVDALSGMLHQLGCLGIQELDDEQWIVYLPGKWSPEHFKNLFRSLEQIGSKFNSECIQLEKLPYRDWNAEWRKYFEPFQAAEGCWIRPPWQALPQNAAGEEIIIDPQMAFGTGHHETTRLMMQAMNKMILTDTRVLDLGTGSGILAIFARKLGARQAIGIDNDPEAIENARHNAGLNKVSKIDFRVGDISLIEGETFPAILANIHFEVLAGLALHFYQALESGGKLLLSGLLQTDVPRISYIYKQAAFLLLDQLVLGEWSALIWEKPWDRRKNFGMEKESEHVILTAGLKSVKVLKC